LLFNLATREAISSVILSSQRVGLTPALYTAGKQKGQQAQAASPLVIDGQKLIPSVTRVFSKAKALYIYLRDYDQGDAPVNPLLAYATFYLDGREGIRDDSDRNRRRDVQPSQDHAAALQRAVEHAGRRRVHI
jgi:hypothetical protein